MPRYGVRAVAAAVLLLATGACGDATSSSPPAAIAPASGDNQIGSAGAAVANPLVAIVTGSNGQPAANATVDWAVTVGNGSVSPVSSITDATGHARTVLTLGATATTVTVTATVRGTTLSTHFSASVQVSSADCTSATAMTPTAGFVNLSVQTASLCLQGDTGGSDYALIPFNISTDPENQATVTVAAQNVVALSTPDARPAVLVPMQLSGGPGAAGAPSRQTDDSFEIRLRREEAQAVRPRMAAARAWMRQGSPRALHETDAIPATIHVGDLLRLNTNETDPCANAEIHTGRVAAITTTAIVVADTANPPGGFSDADYQSFGVQFDTLVNPLDTANFGAPTDIDRNGRILIFFTRAVNALTPPGSGAAIDGFFFGRDLLPQTATPQLEACATSNVGEMFYMRVPDPTGVVNGNKVSISDVESLTVATLAHEYQHLINAGRRIYVNNAQDLETVWLNEGLSHIAEELLFYKVSGLAPRQNLDLPTIQGQQQSVDAYNSYMRANAGRYASYLRSPNTSSVYADDDDLNDRGAIWGFLRWAADHHPGSDASTWRALVNSTTTGIGNLGTVFGTDILQQIRDFTTSVFADDVPGAAEPRALQPSWNWRSIYPGVTTPPAYPLAVLALTSGTPRSVTVRGGGSAYYRFSVSAGQTAFVSWTSTTGGGVNWALVRSR